MQSFLSSVLQEAKSRLESLKPSKKILEEQKSILRAALLSADVDYLTAKAISNKVAEEVLTIKVKGEARKQALAFCFLKVIQSFLSVSVRDSNSTELRGRVMVVGLNGAGKTTTTGKLANYYKKAGKRVLVVPCDFRRPAAAAQLEKLCATSSVDFNPPTSNDLETELLSALPLSQKYEITLFDMAGRQDAEAELLEELAKHYKIISPSHVILVADAAMGQQAASVAAEFSASLNIDSIILTKTDGDALGGTALTLINCLQIPIKFSGTGEKLEDLEPFCPEKMASRIVGEGDLGELARLAQNSAVEFQPSFTLEDFLKQTRAIRSMGSLKSMISMLPKSAKAKLRIDDGHLEEEAFFSQIEAIIMSMTPKERSFPELLKCKSRVFRVAQGSGTHEETVKELLGRFHHMKKILSQD